MATTVKQTYAPRFNKSVTRREGRIVKVTTWITGVSGSTVVETDEKE